MDLEEDIVRRYGGMVWRTVYRLVGRESDAADCFQETFVAALELGRREKVRNWEGMLKRVATTKGLDALRRRVRERKREVAGTIWEEMPGHGGGVDEVAENRELGERMRWALGELSAAQAEAFCMRHLSEMSYEEIGMELEMKANAVGVMLMRAKVRLAELLGDANGAVRSEVNYGK
jgi:RNA polymerase sigma factor (sigma-70 family)